MKIKELIIQNLFGQFSYNINLVEKKDVFIITGPNGYGKTTILRIIESLAKQNFIFFYSILFDKIEFIFDNGQKFIIMQEVIPVVVFPGKSVLSDRIVEAERNTIFSYFLDKNDEKERFIISKAELDKIINGLPSELRNNERQKDYKSEAFENYIKTHKFIYDMLLQRQKCIQIPILLKGISVKFIPSQKLAVSETLIKNNLVLGNQLLPIQTAESVKTSAIKNTVQKLGNQLRTARTFYLNKSQEIDLQLINDLLNENYEVLSEEMYNKKVGGLTKKIEELQQFSLIDSLKIKPYIKGKDKILSAYINGLEKKLNVYDEILAKLKVFNELLTDLQFKNKRFVYSLKDGLIIRMKTDGSQLELNNLSSGEQSEIIMLYDFLFEIQKDSILLIDEPENSLHVAWQIRIKNDLKNIAETNGIQVIIATHSPQILAGDFDDSFDLLENNTNKNIK